LHRTIARAELGRRRPDPTPHGRLRIGTAGQGRRSTSDQGRVADVLSGVAV